MDGKKKGRKPKPQVGGVLPSQPGWVTCLGPCGRLWYSDDKMRLRTCPKCKGKRERMGKAGERVAAVHGVEIPQSEPPRPRKAE